MSDLTKEATLGFHNARSNCPYLYSSASFIAWRLGAWFQDTGRPQPRAVRMSRGYTIRASDMLFRWEASTSHFERLK